MASERESEQQEHLVTCHNCVCIGVVGGGGKASKCFADEVLCRRCICEQCVGVGCPCAQCACCEAVCSNCTITAGAPTPPTAGDGGSGTVVSSGQCRCEECRCKRCCCPNCDCKRLTEGERARRRAALEQPQKGDQESTQ
jgi:hypothetical protein